MITTEWEPTTDHEQLAKVLGLDLEAEADAFREYNRSTEIRFPDRAFSGWLQKSTRKAAATAPAKRDGYRLPPARPPFDPAADAVRQWIDANPGRAGEMREALEDRAEDEGRKGWAAEAWVSAEMRARVIEILDQEQV